MSQDRPTPVATAASRAAWAGMPHPVAILLSSWLLGLMAVAAGRFRGDWDAYMRLHRWGAEHGLPHWARNFDGFILFGAAAFLGAWLAARWSGGSATARLGLQRGRPGWAGVVFIALLPMVVGGAALGAMRYTEGAFDGVFARLMGGVVRAPIAEELLFRGLLVGVVAAVIGMRGTRFWVNAVAAAILFAIMHVPWTARGLADGWPTLLVTGAGGMWYAWLFARWEALWAPMVMHAGMNLGWLLAGAGGGAGGGGWIENLLRVATIALATWWTVRRTKVVRAA